MYELSDDSIPALRKQLIELAQAGDPEAFAALFNCYSPRICRYIEGMARNPDDRDEIAQETFFKAWKELPKLQQASSFKSWLYSIATNVVYDHQRHQKSRGISQQISLEDHLDSCEDLADFRRFEENIVEGELVRQALKMVPWKYRTCLLLEIEGKLSRSEIADVVEISLSSVGTYISKGREYLRQAYHCLEQATNEEGG